MKMSKTRTLLLTILITGFALFSSAKANTAFAPECAGYEMVPDSLCHDTLQTVSSKQTPPEAVKKKIVSALFALPFPCGFMGTHRVMLGTSPWVPVVYVATFGGCFGLLPLIDFCFITFSKDITPFENNPHVFMWVK